MEKRKVTIRLYNKKKALISVIESHSMIEAIKIAEHLDKKDYPVVRISMRD